MHELNIENPIVADLVNAWIEMRKRRMEFENMAMSYIKEAKRELTKFHS